MPTTHDFHAWMGNLFFFLERWMGNLWKLLFFWKETQQFLHDTVCAWCLNLVYSFRKFLLVFPLFKIWWKGRRKFPFWNGLLRSVDERSRQERDIRRQCSGSHPLFGKLYLLNELMLSLSLSPSLVSHVRKIYLNIDVHRVSVQNFFFKRDQVVSTKFFL